MKTSEKIQLYAQLLQLTDYDHKEGGKYAYVQFLSYTREVLRLLEASPEFEGARALIEEVNFQFNEALCSAFGPQQRELFHAQRTRVLLALWEVKLRLEAESDAYTETSPLRRAG